MILAADAARAAGHAAIDAEVLDKHGHWFPDAAEAGIVLNHGRSPNLLRHPVQPFFHAHKRMREPHDLADSRQYLRARRRWRLQRRHPSDIS